MIELSTHITVTVPANAQLCLQTAYDTLLSAGNVSKKDPPHMDMGLLFASAHVDRYVYLITVKKVNENESEMTVTCDYQMISRITSKGVIIQLISDFLSNFSLKLQNIA